MALRKLRLVGDSGWRRSARHFFRQLSPIRRQWRRRRCFRTSLRARAIGRIAHGKCAEQRFDKFRRFLVEIR
jgi:hypothetical protein